MINTNIPIFRAKKMASDEYVIGFYIFDGVRHLLLVDRGNLVQIQIDPTTLAIHFPDMIDSQGNKIFASLSEDGKGGDIVEQEINMYLDDPRPHNGTYWVQTKCPILYKHRSIYVKYDIKDATPKFADGTITNRHGYKTISNIFETKVIGIQK